MLSTSVKRLVFSLINFLVSSAEFLSLGGDVTVIIDSLKPESFCLLVNLPILLGMRLIRAGASSFSFPSAFAMECSDGLNIILLSPLGDDFSMFVVNAVILSSSLLLAKFSAFIFSIVSISLLSMLKLNFA